ncbi:MAG: hypothetical protein U0841_16905 [Chloroflexia bacterium]
MTFVSASRMRKEQPEELVAAALRGLLQALASPPISAAPVTNRNPVTTRATVTLRMDANGPKVAKIHLETEGRVPRIDQATLRADRRRDQDLLPDLRLLTPGLEEVSVNATLVRSNPPTEQRIRGQGRDGSVSPPAICAWLNSRPSPSRARARPSASPRLY